MTNLCRAFECRKYLNSETFHKIGVGKDGGMVGMVVVGVFDYDSWSRARGAIGSDNTHRSAAKSNCHIWIGVVCPVIYACSINDHPLKKTSIRTNKMRSFKCCF